MPNYTKTTTKELTRLRLRRHLDASGISWEHTLTDKVWRDFLGWSRLDPAKHNSLVTLDDWQEEFAEFDCAYTDWLESQIEQENK
jgi:hypothetical protein